MRKFLITVNGASYEVAVEEIGGAAPLAAPVAAPAAPVAAPAAPAPVAAPAAPAAPAQPITGGNKVTAPMPGNILSVAVQAGQKVKEGDLLVVLEAMKMENEIVSPYAGVVLQVAVAKGHTVNTGETLVVIG